MKTQTNPNQAAPASDLEAGADFARRVGEDIVCNLAPIAATLRVLERVAQRRQYHDASSIELLATLAEDREAVGVAVAAIKGQLTEMARLYELPDLLEGPVEVAMRAVERGREPAQGHAA